MNEFAWKISSLPITRQKPPRLRKIRQIEHLAIEADDARFRLGLESGDDRSRLGNQLIEGVKILLMISICAGWIAILPANPSRLATSHSSRNPAKSRNFPCTASIASAPAEAAANKVRLRAKR